MSLIRNMLIVLIITLVLASGLVADDLGFVTLKNEYQATVVGKMVDRVHTRSDNRFLVTMSEDELQRLERAGIEYEILLEDINPDELFVVRRLDRAPESRLDLTALGETWDIGGGLTLVSMGSVSAKSISRTSPYVATPLLDTRARPIYISPAVASFLADITDFPTDSLADRISQDSVYDMNVRLEDFYTRYIYTDSIDRARDWIVQKFQSWGYTEVSTPLFYFNGYPCYNVMAVKQGYAEPDKTIVIGGHYDSITYGWEPGPDIYAPGSDDNASGTVLTMELARVLADIPLRKTVVFMAFSAEEVGLVGSNAAAWNFVGNGTDVEVMYNFDMVGYTESPAPWMLDISSGVNEAYKWVSADAASRVTDLMIFNAAAGGSSDHASFENAGFNVVNHIETEFNYDGWHTNLDLTARMNFDMLTKVAKMAVASLAIVANSAHPTEITEIVDQGDGQSLEITWSDCDPEYSYLVYHGPSSGNYTDMVVVPQGTCSWVVDGLPEGQERFFSVVGTIPDGYPAVYAVEGSEYPYIVPRAPTQVAAEPELNSVAINWADNREADFHHYRIYRGIEDLALVMQADNVMTSEYQDNDVMGQIGYTYKIMAVDNDGYESDLSEPSYAIPATFDGGILVVDEIRQGGGMPTQPVQEAWISEVMATTPYNLIILEATGDRLSRNDAGQYSSIFWFDDDFSPKLINESNDTLAWYTDYETNLFLSGFRTIEYWHESPTSPGMLLYDEFGLHSYTVHAAFDFAVYTDLRQPGPRFPDLLLRFQDGYSGLGRTTMCGALRQPQRKEGPARVSSVLFDRRIGRESDQLRQDHFWGDGYGC